jgi:hypothetical protein
METGEVSSLYTVMFPYASYLIGQEGKRLVDDARDAGLARVSVPVLLPPKDTEAIDFQASVPVTFVVGQIISIIEHDELINLSSPPCKIIDLDEHRAHRLNL